MVNVSAMTTDQKAEKEKFNVTQPLQRSEGSNVNADLESLLFFGPYQIAVFIVYQVSTFAFAFNLLFLTFVGWEPSWDCQATNETVQRVNSTLADRCERLQSGQCTNITWSHVSFSSIVSEWNLICSNRSVLYMIITIQMVGLLLGAPLMTHVADFCGRKSALLACLAGQSVCGIGTGFSHTWQVFAVSRFLVGFFGGGLIPIAGVYLVESVNRSYRMLFMSFGGINMGFLLSACMAFLFQHWSSLTIAASSVGFVAILILGFASETPRWLIQHGKVEQSRRSYRYILRWNRKSSEQMNDDEWEALLSQIRRPVSKRRSFWHLFQTRKLSLKTTVLMFSIFTLNVITTVLMLSMTDLSGSIYLNSMIYGFVLWGSAVLSGLLDRFLRSVGRRCMIGSLLSIVSVCLLAMSISKWLESTIHILESVFVFVGTAATSPMWVSLTLIILESYPTSMRSIAAGFSSIFSNIGGVVAPQLLAMAQQWKPIPWLVLAFMSVAFMVSFMAVIPETKGRPLVEEIDDQHKPQLISKEEQHV
ncbi:transporter, major facilitator family protein [Trichuris suis]|nr:transporter, major facilitator family protein [Trichuris suis]